MNKDLITLDTIQLEESLKELGITTPKEMLFFEEYIRNGFIAYKAYQKVYGSKNTNIASTLANRLLKKVTFVDLLSLSGHGLDSMYEALTEVKKKQPAKYVEFQNKYRNLDTTNINHNVDGTLKVEIIQPKRANEQ
jgi:hypothetical protein